MTRNGKSRAARGKGSLRSSRKRSVKQQWQNNSSSFPISRNVSFYQNIISLWNWRRVEWTSIPNTIVIVYPRIRGMNECARHVCLARWDIPWISPTIIPLRDLTSHCVGDCKNVSANTHVAAVKRFARRRAAGRSAALGDPRAPSARARRCVGAAGRSPRPRSFISALIGVSSWLSLVSRVSVAGARATARSEFRTRERRSVLTWTDDAIACGGKWRASSGGPGRERKWCVALSVHHEFATLADPRPETGNFEYRSSSVLILSRHVDACNKCTNACSPRRPSG